MPKLYIGCFKIQSSSLGDMALFQWPDAADFFHFARDHLTCPKPLHL